MTSRKLGNRRFLKPGCDQLFRAARNDNQACKEEHDVLVKALNEFLSLVQNGFKVIDAHASAFRGRCPLHKTRG